MVSGGLGDIILALLKSLDEKFLEGGLDPQISIFSNKILFDQNDHMYFDSEFFNKREQCKEVPTRKNLLVIGDNIGDNFMADHKDHNNIISICIID